MKLDLLSLKILVDNVWKVSFPEQLSKQSYCIHIEIHPVYFMAESTPF